MSKNMSKALKHLTHEQLLALFDDAAAQKRIQELSGLATATALVVFENREQHSPERGKRTVVAVGSGLTHKSVRELTGSWIFEGERRQKAIAFCEIPTTQTR